MEHDLICNLGIPNDSERSDSCMTAQSGCSEDWPSELSGYVTAFLAKTPCLQM